MLKSVGVTAREERVYRLLLHQPGTTLRDLAEAAGTSSTSVRRTLASLEAKGFVSHTPEKEVRYLPAPPEMAVEALILRQESERQQARVAAAQLQEEFNRGRTRSSIELIDVVANWEATRQRYFQTQAGAKEEVLLIDRPPYLVPPAGPNPTELELLARHVRYRVIYTRAALTVPGKLESILRCMAAGEEARVLPELPVKFLIADRRIALVYEMQADSIDRAIIVHTSSVLDGFVMLFDMLWERALPIPVALGTGTHEPGAAASDELDSHILARMAAGMKDEAIARQIGIGLRTLRRRTAALMRSLEADTRFEAGAKAARLGWLDGGARDEEA